MTADQTVKRSFLDELKECWTRLPYKPVFLTLCAAWLLLFQFLGNSTLGYVNTASLFGWMNYAYSNSDDDAHGWLIPVAVLVLLWWKREQLLAVEKRHWWPGVLLIGAGLALHILGFVVQQTRLSIVGFFVGLYGITGAVWGPQWLARTFFPFCLFAFCVPLATISETLTFPLRVLATKITTAISSGVFGINVIQDGTRIFDSNGMFQYEVAAACSGLRSLTAIAAIATVYAFMNFDGMWKRLIILATAFPLAVAANVVRLLMIILSAELFGQEAGNYVHESSWLSLLPYLPAIAGLFGVGWLLDRGTRPVASAKTLSPVAAT